VTDKLGLERMSKRWGTYLFVKQAEDSCSVTNHTRIRIALSSAAIGAEFVNNVMVTNAGLRHV
jgi:hypothetical protein